MHFFNPVHKMKLIEIVRALESSAETLETIEAVARQMGKETVLVRESPGFITTRVNATIGNEAFFMLMEGVASARDIDKALKLGLNHPMGPFELVDLVGLDTRLSILEYLHRAWARNTGRARCSRSTCGPGGWAGKSARACTSTKSLHHEEHEEHEEAGEKPGGSPSGERDGRTNVRGLSSASSQPDVRASVPFAAGRGRWPRRAFARRGRLAFLSFRIVMLSSCSSSCSSCSSW